jgi:hypothetical protein
MGRMNWTDCVRNLEVLQSDKKKKKGGSVGWSRLA